MVHGFDSEAAIGERKDFEHVTVQKLLIKEKINLTEQARMYLNHGVDQNAIIRYLYNDMGNMAEAVKTRTEAMKIGRHSDVGRPWHCEGTESDPRGDVHEDCSHDAEKRGHPKSDLRHERNGCIYLCWTAQQPSFGNV